MNHRQRCAFHHLQILQQGALVFYSIQSKEPFNGPIIQADHAASTCAPLRLQPGEHQHRIPILRPHLEVFRLLLLNDDAKRLGVTVELFATVATAAGPMLSGGYQFFRLPLLRLSSQALTIAAATSGTFRRSALAFSLNGTSWPLAS